MPYGTAIEAIARAEKANDAVWHRRIDEEVSRILNAINAAIADKIEHPCDGRFLVATGDPFEQTIVDLSLPLVANTDTYESARQLPFDVVNLFR